MIHKIPTAEARKNFADIVNNVADGKEPIVLMRRGKALAALVSIEDLEILQRIEDQQDIADAWKIKDEPGENIKLSDLKKELNL
ncbi:type II toxin-antitoxin system Phd/YefM family antitoxin [candidate division KSB1 bacterium]|nr:type II toxin-antitoxin system Phd/YefM family antitoxin [candidate division KSB1 bacterium]